MNHAAILNRCQQLFSILNWIYETVLCQTNEKKNTQKRILCISIIFSHIHAMEHAVQSSFRFRLVVRTFIYGKTVLFFATDTNERFKCSLRFQYKIERNPLLYCWQKTIKSAHTNIYKTISNKSKFNRVYFRSYGGNFADSEIQCVIEFLRIAVRNICCACFVFISDSIKTRMAVFSPIFFIFFISFRWHIQYIQGIPFQWNITICFKSS